MPKVKVIRIANPHKKRRAAVGKSSKVRRGRRPSRAKKNPWPQGVLTLMSNPKKRKKRNPFAAAGRERRSYRRRRSNPTYKARRRTHRRRNPFSVAGNRPAKLVTLGLSAGAGGIATRFLPNLVAKRFNEGLAGYGLNVLSAIALGMVAGKTLGKEEGVAVLLGGLAATGIRIWDDNVSKVLPIAAAVKAGATPGVTIKGLGDASFSDDGLGRFEAAQWPGVQLGPGQPALPAPVAAYPQPF